MKKIIQISIGGNGEVYALTKDGKVYRYIPKEWNTIGGVGSWIELEAN